MSSKPKALLKQSKPKHKKTQTLETANDYQAAGVDFEDAAGKWRAGDAVKSMRFFNRALEVYEQGLQKFPQSFDLAYNKARVQLEVATHPVLVRQLQQPVYLVLQSALVSHRYALSLDQDNADLLFNTSQLLTSIAEEIAKSNAYDDADALQCLEEALELQNRCMSLQELKYEEVQQQQQHGSALSETHSDDTDEDDEDDEDGGAPVESSKVQEEQWFSIVEPVTQDTLIDTVLAQLGTLTTLCGVLSNSPNMVPEAMLAWVEEFSSRILDKKLPLLVPKDHVRLSETALVKANFVSALLEAGFRAGKIDAATYRRERDAVFGTSQLELENSAEALMNNARSLISFNSALADIVVDHDSNLETARWNALLAAIRNLVTASKIAAVSNDDLAKTHLLRGDCSMLQHRMGLAPISYPNAVTNAQQLLKNAEIFYRNASRLSPDIEVKAVAELRSAVAHYVQQGDKSSLDLASQGKDESWLAEELEEMIVEGLLPNGFQVTI